MIAAANQRGVAAVLVTNQAGIGRGYYGWDEFVAVQNAIALRLETEGARLDAVYACPHHPDGTGDFRHLDHPARKPNPGMILRAASDLALDLRRGLGWSATRASDIDAAKRAGLAGAMLVMAGYGERERGPMRPHSRAADFDVRFGASITAALALPVLAAP